MRSHFHSHCRLIAVGMSLLASAFLCAGASAQSVNPKKPAPLQAGSNTGAVDTNVGNNYFYFRAGPGTATVTATYKSLGLLGYNYRSDLPVELSNASKTPMGRLTITPKGVGSQQHVTITLKKETEVFLAIVAPTGSLLATGGEYDIAATGAVRFDPAPTDTELIVGTYTPGTTYADEDNTAVKFLPDGTLQFAAGSTGTWKLFDADTHLYTVTFASEKLSLKLVPGRGLVSAADATSIVFKRTS